MLNPLALTRGSHYLENAWRLAVLAELAYQDDPARRLMEFAEHYRRLEPFRMDGTFGFVASNEQNVVVALRGTDEVLDWVTNLTVAQIAGYGGCVHRGFCDSLDQAWNEILVRVTSLLDNDQTLWVAGHSLGGALATIAAARLMREGLEPYVTCTFGSPRVFDPKAAAGYLPRLYRFVNKGDAVPSVPPALTLPWYRYQHTGSLTVVLDKERGHAAHMDGFGQDAFSMLRWLLTRKIDLQEQITRALEDHAMQTYISLIKSELGAETVARLESGVALKLPLSTRIKPRRALAA